MQGGRAVPRGPAPPRLAGVSSPCLLSTNRRCRGDFVPGKEEAPECPLSTFFGPSLPSCPPRLGRAPQPFQGSRAAAPSSRAGVGVQQSDRRGLSPVPLTVCVATPGRQRLPWARGGGGCPERPSAVTPQPGLPCTPTAVAAPCLQGPFPNSALTQWRPGAVSGWASESHLTAQGAGRHPLPGSGLYKEGACSNRARSSLCGPCLPPPACSPGPDTGPQTLSGAASEPHPDLGWARR